MHHALLMHVGHSEHDLLEEKLGRPLFQPSSLFDVFEEIATRTELHYNEIVLHCLERL